MLRSHPLMRYYMAASLLLGIILGMVSIIPSTATAQWSFAGYQYTGQTNDGVIADIGYVNPTVTAGQSLEWVMASNDANRFIQSGWIKRTIDTSPHYFVEYKCATICQFIFNTVPNGKVSSYRVELLSTWCAYIDGVPQSCVTTGDLGMNDANRAIYSGETSDTVANMGESATNHLRLNNLRFKTTSGTWFQVNTTQLSSVTTPGTRYRASAGFTNPFTWTDNWTQ